MSVESLSSFIARLPAGPEAARPLYRVGDSRVAGQFYACHLGSVFQPVVHRDGGMVGHSAYVRCSNGADLSPWNLFAQAADDDELIQLDRLARTVHAINYFQVSGNETRLFLRVDSRLLQAVPVEHGKTFERVLASFGVPAGRVVIVLPEAVNANPALLALAAANYRLRGYGVAVSHLAPTVDWLRELTYVRPAIVKLRYTSSGVLQKQVEAVHELGSLALVTHIESAEAHSAAVEAGTDWCQGYALGGVSQEPTRIGEYTEAALAGHTI